MENKILIYTCIDYIKDNYIYDFLDDFFQEYTSYDYESFIDKLCKIDKGLNRCEPHKRHNNCLCGSGLFVLICCCISSVVAEGDNANMVFMYLVIKAKVFEYYSSSYL